MPDIVLLSKVRERKSIEATENLVAGLKKLLKAAKKGELRGLCYATVNTNDCSPSASSTHPNAVCTS